MTMRHQSFTETNHNNHMEDPEQNEIREDDPSKTLMKKLLILHGQPLTGTGSRYPQRERKAQHWCEINAQQIIHDYDEPTVKEALRGDEATK